MAIVAAAPSVASAAINGINEVALTPNQSGPSGAVMNGSRIQFTVTVDSGTATAAANTPRGLRFTFNNGTQSACLGVRRVSGFSWETSATLSLTLPRFHGNGEVPLDVTAFRGTGATGDARCATAGGAPSATRTIDVRVIDPAPNARLPNACGLKVMLVLDESGSINPNGGPNHVGDVQSAASQFVNALTGTGSQLAIIAFSRRARQGVDYRPVNSATENIFDRWIGHNGMPGQTVDGHGGYDPRDRIQQNGTNFQDPFELVQTINATAGPANLVVFVTDGDPNFHNGIPETGPALPDGAVAAMLPAQKAADLVKEQEGSRVFAIGVGAAVSGQASQDRLTAISGPTRLGSHNFRDADYIVDSFEHLGETLRDIVTQQCASSLIVSKVVNTPDGEQISGGEGWRFDGHLTVAGGTHVWIEPHPGSTAATVTQTTDEFGVAPFKWTPQPATASSTLRVTPHELPGYSLDHTTCILHPQDTTETFTSPSFDAIVGAEQYSTCKVVNTLHTPVAHIVVRKVLKPSHDHGRFDLRVNHQVWFRSAGNGDQTEAIPIPPGTKATVDEQVTALQRPDITLDQYDITTVCVNAAGGHVAAGTGGGPLKVPVAHPGEKVTCTITNHRKPGAPPEPPAPPSPGSRPTDPCIEFPAHPDCEVIDPPPPLIQRTSLDVHKTMPAHAQVGQRVPITITVRNTGHHTALNVAVRETPPGGDRIVLAGDRGSVQPDGTILWRLGSLRPGEQRTVHATMLVLSAGLHLNRALADASNAQVVISTASLHASPRPRGSRPPHRPHPTPPPPRVTG